MTEIRLPILEQVEFHGFSLYSNRPSQKVAIRPGVFCLAGANGLGKSTFLGAVGYALTGVVVDPDDRFESVEEHYGTTSTTRATTSTDGLTRKTARRRTFRSLSGLTITATG
jgi:DNA repair exonuclease SbcCD ATPase subunit